MSPSVILSRFSRLALLSVFCAGLFVTSGELSVNNGGEVEVGSGGVYSAMAADTTPAAEKPTKKEVADETINSIISFLNLGIGVLTFLITPLIMLAGWLLSPDWTFGEIFGLRPILHQLWILISNVVYVIFGFMLVFVAFANIFGWEHSKAYEMKTMLPKLVTGMLMVPFTWFIVSAVLSVSNVLTASVIQLPVATILNSGGDTKGLLADKIIPKEITFDKNSSGEGTVDSNGKALSEADKNKVDANGESTTAYTKNWNFYASDCDDDENQCLSIKEFLTSGGWGAYNLLSVYAYGIFRIQEYKAITTEQNISKVLDIAYKLWYWVIFFIIFGILIIAIVYALFSRALMLWLYAMFSPIFALMYVTGSKHKSLEKFSVKEFISLAMVPVYVSAALAFGLMFLGLVMSATGSAEKTGNGTLSWDSVNIETKDSTTTFKFWTGDKGITLKTVGLLDPEAKNGASKALDIGKGIIGTIIMNVLALVILWMAVMAALGANEITKAAVKPIADMGDSVGQLMKNAPQYIPIPWAGGQSMKSVTQWVGNIRSGVEQNVSTKANEISRKFLPSETASRNQAITDTTAAIARGVKPEIAQEFQKLKNTYSNFGEFVADGRAQIAMQKMGASFHVDPKLMEDLSTKEKMTKFLSALDEKWKPQVELFKMDHFGGNIPYLEQEFQHKTGVTPTAAPSPIAPTITVTWRTTPSNFSVNIATPAEWTNHAKIDSGEFTRLLAELKNSNTGVDEAILKTELTKALKENDIDIW